MVRYRRVSIAMWSDRKFRALTPPAPNPRVLWFYLLTGRHTCIVPGLLGVGKLTLAEELGWDVTGLMGAFQELLDQNMVMVDWEARLIWLPMAVHHNPPDSPNVASAWRAGLMELPECDLRKQVEQYIEHYLSGIGTSFVMAWTNGKIQHTGKPSREVYEAVKTRDKNRCRYCGHRVNWQDRRGEHGACYDHIDPRGKSTLENIVVSCRSCHSIKCLRTQQEAGMSLTYTEQDSHLDSDLNEHLENDQGKSGPGSALQEQEQEQEQNQEKEPPIGGMSPGGDPVSAPPTIQDVLDLWNPIPGAKPVNLDRLTPDRGLHKRITVLTRQHKKDPWEFWRMLFVAVDAQRNFLFSGATSKTGWTADLAWVLGPENMAKVLERRYENFKLPAEVLPNMPGALRAVAGPPQGGCNWHPDGAWCELRVMTRTGNERRCGWHVHVDRYNRPATRDEFEQWVGRANALLLPKPIPSLDELWAMVNRGVSHGVGSPDR